MTAAYIGICAANIAASGFWVKQYGKKWVVFGAALAVIFSAVVFLSGMGLYGLLAIAMEGMFFVSAIEDIKHMSVPTKLLLAEMLFSVVMMFFVPDTQFWLMLVTALFFGGILFIISKKSHGSIGMADVVCITVAAFSLPLDAFIRAVFTAMFLAVIFGVGLMLFKKKKAQTQIPFIPFMAFSYITAVMFL